jgi:hypothetical protein
VIDAAVVEADAAMKSLVQRLSEKNWREFLKQFAREARLDDHSTEGSRWLDRGRRDKKISDREWKSSQRRTAGLGT